MENKTLIGKVDDVYGPITGPGIAIKPAEGVKGTGFQKGDKVGNLAQWVIFISRSEC
jgi:rRNA processing protein Gar1